MIQVDHPTRKSDHPVTRFRNGRTHVPATMNPTNGCVKGESTFRGEDEIGGETPPVEIANLPANFVPGRNTHGRIYPTLTTGSGGLSQILWFYEHTAGFNVQAGTRKILENPPPRSTVYEAT